MPAAQLAVLDVTCELPLQVAAPAYLALPTWDTHCAHGGMETGVGRGEAGVSPCRDMPTCASGCTLTVVCPPSPGHEQLASPHPHRPHRGTNRGWRGVERAPGGGWPGRARALRPWAWPQRRHAGGHPDSPRRRGRRCGGGGHARGREAPRAAERPAAGGAGGVAGGQEGQAVKSP